MSHDRIHIALVDDNQADVYLFRLALQKAELDFEMTVLGDGAHAIAYIRGEEPYASAPIPDLIILDFNLPKYDGGQILQVLAHAQRFAHIPIVVASSQLYLSRMSEIGERVSKCIRKPADLDEFLELGGVLKQVLLESKHEGLRS